MQPRKQKKRYNVFCYGTLEFAAVMKKIAGVSCPKEPATLIDYARYLVKDAPYPGIVYEPGAVTEGSLFRNLNVRQVECMDEYEGGLYERIESEVLTKKGELIMADIYIVPLTSKHHLTRLPWNKEEFERLYMKNFFKIL